MEDSDFINSITASRVYTENYNDIEINEETISILKQIQKQSIEFKDILGTHKGIIHTLQIKDNGIFAYGIFFGQMYGSDLMKVHMNGKK